MIRALAPALLLLVSSAARAARIPVPRARDLTDDELVGQLFLIAVDTDIAAAREADFRAGRVGGVLLRWDRFSADGARAMAELLRRWSADAPHRVPVWVSVDHEGGPTFTQRGYGVAPFPGNMALGAARSPELARAAARETGRELSALGVSVTFAPVLDVNSNPENPVIGLRSFSDDPALVAELGAAAVRGYRDAGVLAVVKHFPGHGAAGVDSHLGLPVDARPLAELERVELKPFRAAIKAGAQAVMPAHMVFPALGCGPGRPVTLSSAAVTGFLRGRMGFRGLIFSDGLDMGAVAGVEGSSRAAVGALEAGEDVLVLGKADFPSAFAAVRAALDEGRLTRSRLEASVDRVLAAKRRLGLFSEGEPRPLTPGELARGRQLARQVAEASVTVVRAGGLLPLKAGVGRLGVVICRSPRYEKEASRLVDELRRRSPELTAVVLPTNPSDAELDDAAAGVSNAETVIIGTSQFGGPLPRGQRRLLRRLMDLKIPVVALSLMNPYDLSFSTSARAAAALYGLTDSSVDAAARVLFGEIPARGRLPVRLPPSK